MNKKPTQIEAILVMDSRTTSIALRSQSFGGAWSKLYKMDEFYLDLSLKPERDQAMLMGRLVNSGPQVAGSVSLVSQEGECLRQVSLNDAGIFRLPVTQGGTYQLQMLVGEQQFVVRSLDL